MNDVRVTPSKTGHAHSEMSEPDGPEFSKDLLRGAAAIAVFIFGDRKHRRKVFHLWATSRAPFFKMGSMICARRSVLLKWVADEETQRGGH